MIFYNYKQAAEPNTDEYDGFFNIIIMEEGAEKHRNRIEANSMKKESGGSSPRRHIKNSLPPLFLYIEAGNFRRAAERAKKHPREVRTWASIKIKSSVGNQQRLTTTKRLALHHACFKVRIDNTYCNEVLFLIK